MMNEERIVDNMIAFIECLERDLQTSKMASDGKISGRTEVVNSILDKLEKEFKDEN